MQPTPNDLPELLYIYDAYCGWCYGMSPVMQRVQANFAGSLTVAVLSGGMLAGERAESIGAGWGYIVGAMPQVEQATGVRFGEAYKQLGEAGSYFQDSEAPGRALYVVRQLDAQGRVLDFAHEVQLALFERGEDLNDARTYGPLVQALGLDVPEFSRQFELPETGAAVRREFEAVGRIGVQGFPTIILRAGSQGYVLSRGFQPYDVFARNLEQALAQVAEEQGD
ncbi:protein-disulfide isomerase [Hymenobacter amundsenii]|uniref:Protein-disulfide isomerase n=1 Tax=Hymenobacter amundsenii TaxID=2006685 RepID=A0A246FMF3_9BACT|nr:DsbA family protein [Hymenobacter amundsenii]OWP63918.1 protein-disulfide isomerase [Hymenobacter amundsenii]